MPASRMRRRCARSAGSSTLAVVAERRDAHDERGAAKVDMRRRRRRLSRCRSRCVPPVRLGAGPVTPWLRILPSCDHDAPTLQYRLISADSHVNEPPDLWTSRVPAALRDRAPRIESFERGRRLGHRGRRRPDQLRHERLRRARARGDAGAGCASKTSAAAGTTRRRGSRRWTATASTPRCCIPRPASPTRSSPTAMPSTTSPWFARTTTGSPSTSSTRPSASAGSPSCRTVASTAALEELDRVARTVPACAASSSGC